MLSEPILSFSNKLKLHSLTNWQIRTLEFSSVTKKQIMTYRINDRTRDDNLKQNKSVSEKNEHFFSNAENHINMSILL